MSREQRDWPAMSGPTGLGVSVRRGVVRCRKKRSAFWQRGIAIPFYRWYEIVRSCSVILYLGDEINTQDYRLLRTRCRKSGLTGS